MRKRNRTFLLLLVCMMRTDFPFVKIFWWNFVKSSSFQPIKKSMHSYFWWTLKKGTRFFKEVYIKIHWKFFWYCNMIAKRENCIKSWHIKPYCCEIRIEMLWNAGFKLLVTLKVVRVRNKKSGLIFHFWVIFHIKTIRI